MEEQTFITLKDIDTSIAAENFNKLLDEEKTYFLNGSWGSGKTTFLESTESQSKKKFVTIDLWRNTDKRSLVEVAYAGLHPVLYWGALLFSFLFVIITILMTNTVNLGLSKFLHPIWILPVGLISLVVTAVQLVAIKTEIVYSWLLANLCLKNKVLVIDDFDRLTELQQEEAYRLFSLLRGKLPIIFVGDIENIYCKKNNDSKKYIFLSKIIDRRLELPFILHPQNIWDDFFRNFKITVESFAEVKLDTERLRAFKNIVISERKNLRDRERFTDYVNQEIIKKNKLQKVQLDQQLVIIYIYLFYPSIYSQLIEKAMDLNLGSIKYSECNSTTNDNNLHQLISILENQENRRYPTVFKNNPKNYFLFEQPSNRTQAELQKIFSDKNKVKTELEISSFESDFYQFISCNLSNDKKYYEQIGLQLFKDSIELSLSGKNSDLIDFCIKDFIENGHKSYYDSPDYDEMLESFITTLPIISQLDNSERAYLAERHKIPEIIEYLKKKVYTI